MSSRSPLELHRADRHVEAADGEQRQAHRRLALVLDEVEQHARGLAGERRLGRPPAGDVREDRAQDRRARRTPASAAAGRSCAQRRRHASTSRAPEASLGMLGRDPAKLQRLRIPRFSRRTSHRCDRRTCCSTSFRLSFIVGVSSSSSALSWVSSRQNFLICSTRANLALTRSISRPDQVLHRLGAGQAGVVAERDVAVLGELLDVLQVDHHDRRQVGRLSPITTASVM